MKAIHKRRTINLFMAEIIIALLFFSISGAVILRVFAQADIKSRKSAQLEDVIICAQSLAEAYSETGDIVQAARTLWGSPVVDRGDPEKTVISFSKIRFEAFEERTETSSGELSELTMVFMSDGEEIYTLSCSSYIPANIS